MTKAIKMEKNKQKDYTHGDIVLYNDIRCLILYFNTYRNQYVATLDIKQYRAGSSYDETFLITENIEECTKIEEDVNVAAENHYNSTGIVSLKSNTIVAFKAGAKWKEDLIELLNRK